MRIPTLFLADILEYPDNDAPRLAAADWLEEKGDADRAQFIRLQCERGPVQEDDTLRDVLPDPEGILFRQHREEWLSEVQTWARDKAIFRRGFAGSIKATPRAFLKGAAGLFRKAPIDEVRLSHVVGFEKQLAECEYLAKLRRLNLEFTRIPPKSAKVLFTSPHLVNLRTIDLMHTDLSAESLQILSESLSLSQLKALHLNCCAFAYEGAVILSKALNMGRLEFLSFGGTRIGDRGLAKLAASRRLKNMRILRLGNTDIGPAGAVALAEGPLLSGLERLNISGEEIGDEGAIALAESPRSAKLEWLNLTGCELTDLAVFALCESPHLRLKTLILERNKITDRGARALARSPVMKSLIKLDLGATDITDRGALAFLKSKTLEGLTRITFDFGKTTEAIAPPFKARFGDGFHNFPW
jgi:uncharacterized protein (TIGR02996 family)